MKILKVLMVFTVLAAGAQGQSPIIVDDGEAYTLPGSTNIYPANVYVGVTEDGNTFHVDDGLELTADSMFVGSSNSAGNVVSFDSGSRGYFGYEVSIGAQTTNNLMEIKPGAEVYSVYGTVGGSVYGGSEDADGNEVLVSGSGSRWNVTSNLVVGLEGAENSLTVRDGGKAVADTMYVGVYDEASHNSVMVSEGTLVVSNSLVLGDKGAGNSLVVTNGGLVSAADITIGYNEVSTGNVARVGGAGSILETGTMEIGSISNSGNRVVVSDGGEVRVDGLLINGDENGFDLNEGGRLTVTDDFNASLEGFSFNDGAALYVGGELTGMTNIIEKGRTLGIAGDDGYWDMSGSNVSVGGLSSGNQLVVEGNGKVVADGLLVGTGFSTDNNTVSVNTRGASVVVGSVEVGSVESTGNTVELVDGGKMIVSDGINISGSNNIFSVKNGGHLFVDNDFDAMMDGFDFGRSGTLETSGELALTNALDGYRSVWLTGTNAQWNLGGESLLLDTAQVRVTEGAALSSQGGELVDRGRLLIEGSGSEWLNSGALIVGQGTTNVYVDVLDGGGMTSTDAELGFGGYMNAITVSGSNAQWIASGALTVGEAGRDNYLHILNGGVVSNASAVIGLGADSSGNHVLVQGVDSEWGLSGDLTVGGAGSGNSLKVLDDGQVFVGQDLTVQSNSLVVVNSGGGIAANAYSQDGTSLVQFDSVTNVAVDPGSALITVDTTSELEAGAAFEFTSEIGEISRGETNSRLLVASSSLVVDGVTNATGTDLEVLSLNDPSSLRAYRFYSENNHLYMQIFRQNLAESAGFEEGTDMYGVCEEIDDMASAGSTTANRQLTILEGLSGSQQNAQLSQLYDRHAPSYMHQEGMLEGMRQVKKSGVMPDTMWPIGAGGPHLYGDQVQGWIKGYGSWATRDGSEAYSGYDQNVYGVMVGFDKAYGDLLAGLAGGYASSDISQEDGDSSESGTGYGVLYGSWGTSAWFADGSVAYGMGSVEHDSGTVFDTTSETDLSQFAFMLGGGREMMFMDDRLFLTPSAAFLAGWYSQDGYTEEASNAVGRQVDDYDRWSMRSDLGVKAEFHKELGRTVLMPEVHLNWLHEFNDDEDKVGYSLVDGTGEYHFGMQSPVADLIEVGIGLSLWAESKSDVVYEWAIGFDSRFGDGYSASSINARLVAEF